MKRSRTILFVDDEEKCRKYFDRIYGPAFGIILAADGEEAIRVFKERQEEIGMVVTDQIMPRLTGLDLLDRVGKENPGVIRVLSTAYADSELVARAARQGVFDYFIIKPWDIARTGSVLEQAVDHFEHGSESAPLEGQAG